MSWDDAERLLCVRLDGIGDVLLCTPAIRALKGSGKSSITLLTSTEGSKAGQLISEVDDVIPYDPPWMKATPPRRDNQLERVILEELGGRRFDGAVIFTAYTQASLPAAYLCYLAGIPRRLAHCRFKPYQLLTDWVPDPEPDHQVRHEVRRQLDLVASIGRSTADERLSLRVPEADRERVAELLEESGVAGSERWAVLHPGATAPSRRYPWWQFAEVGRELVCEAQAPVIFTGTAAERRLVEAIRLEMSAPSISLAGRLSLGELAALISLAPVLVSNNTGPVHIAAAVGTPVVDIYALTNPQHTPWMVRHRLLFHDVPCRNCQSSVCPEGHHRCLRTVEPEQVVEAALSLLDGERPGLGAVQQVSIAPY